jgi:hypothetical protein
MKKNYLIVVVIGVILITAFILTRSTEPADIESVASEPPATDPLEVTLEFFNQWIGNDQSSGAVISREDLINSSLFSDDARSKIMAALSTSAGSSPDPVTCQDKTPPRIVGKILYVEPLDAQLMMLARGTDERSTYQAVVTLRAVSGEWQIADISCAQGDIPPDRDYDFENEGFLLKSVPPPLDPDTWHLVYEQNGIMGHTLPLTIDESSVCVDASGSEASCDESNFRDATKVFLRADMTETGAIVRRLEF